MDDVLRLYRVYGIELSWEKIQRCLIVTAGVILLSAGVELGGAGFRNAGRVSGMGAGSVSVKVFSEDALDLPGLFWKGAVRPFPEGGLGLSGIDAFFENAPDRKPEAPPGTEKVQNPQAPAVPFGNEKPDAGMTVGHHMEEFQSLAAGGGMVDVRNGERAGKAIGFAASIKDVSEASQKDSAKCITVSAYGNGGMPEVTETAVRADAFTVDALEVPKRLGKIFDGWYLEPECLTPFSEASMGADSLALYARWSEFPGFFANDLGHITGCTGSVEAILEGFLCIPTHESLTGIERGAFDGMEEEILEIYIPAGITYIEDGVFDNLSRLMYIEVAGENPAYYSEQGILYHRDGTEAAYPMGRMLPGLDLEE